MTDTVIKLEGLAKQYRIGGRPVPYRTVRDTIADAFARPFRRMRRGPSGKDKMFWALSDVSLEIQAGAVVGIIGRNGAGKSTLLKILSRITEPTAGYAEIRGRVGSLLEVGTGFHPELTGRENIYLNGAILGMKRVEIARKFDEIVAFAEIETFIDTPVKHYSSGMYLRLAFAVAAHLEPEILLVDEVLAVGDIAFQRKCTGKMSEVAREGRTVVFVSHNMAALRHLCNWAYLLSNGRVVANGPAEDVIRTYIASTSSTATSDLKGITDRKGKGDIRLQSIRYEDGSGAEIPGLISGKPGRIVLKVRNSRAFSAVRACVSVLDSYNQCVMYLNSYFVTEDLPHLPPNGELVCDIPRVHLAPGTYRLGLWVQSSSVTTEDRISDAGALQVLDGDFFKTGRAVPYGFGVALMDYKWSARAAAGEYAETACAGAPVGDGPIACR